MYYLITFLIFCFTSAGFADFIQQELTLSTPEQVATLSHQEGSLIKGLISPISGNLVLKQTDLCIKGAQNLPLTRLYIAPFLPSSLCPKKQTDKTELYQHLVTTYRGWQLWPHLNLRVNPLAKEVRLTTKEGITLDFSTKDGALASSSLGMNNASLEKVGGIYDLRNIKVALEEEGNKVVVFCPDHSVKIYRAKEGEQLLETGYCCLLEKEILPSGKIFKYEYQGHLLTHIKALSPDERFVYAAFAITQENDSYTITGSDDTKATYQYLKKSTQVKKRQRRRTRSEVIDYHFPPLLTSITSSLQRKQTIGYSDEFLLNQSNAKNAFFNCSYNNESSLKIHKLFFPSGEENTFQIACELSYPAAKEELTTVVKNADGTKEIYRFFKNFLLKAIESYDTTNTLRLQKKFTWGENQWLQAVEYLDQNNVLLYQKTYGYDLFGNPIVEKICGQLTGENPLETYTIKREFSQDGTHLLLKEEQEEGKVVCYKYLPHTNLVTSKLTKDKETIILREFYVYDDCNNLIQKIVDNGSQEDLNDLTQVSTRYLTYYFLRQEAPFLHLPQTIEERYLEEGKEKLLKKTCLTYDKWGNICQEDLYDANGMFAYGLVKEYDEKGNLLLETNALGQTANYTYDDFGNCIESHPFASPLTHKKHFDVMGRLKKLEEFSPDAPPHITTYLYESTRLLETVDPFGNKTKYTYDLGCQKIQKTEHPDILNAQKMRCKVSHQTTYDALGRVVKQIDANGHSTVFAYNLYGKPIKITYPNQGQKTFSYYKNGLLKTKTNLDNVTKKYTYNALGQLTFKQYFFNEEELAHRAYSHTPFHLIEKTDKENNLTQYSYDGAGRKIKKEVCGRVKSFTYDALGRLFTVIKYNEANSVILSLQKDLLNRVLEKKKMDLYGNTLYKAHFSYDDCAGQKTVTCYINNLPSTETFTYNSTHRLIESKDALGFVTTISYDNSYLNPLGQRVLQTLRLDPNQVRTLTTYDAYGRIASIKMLNPHSQVIFLQENTFDPCGNLVLTKKSIYPKGQIPTHQTFAYVYDASHHIQDFFFNEEKLYSYTYTPAGRLASKTFADQTALFYSYHPFGTLATLTSSDGKLDHTFEYTHQGHLLSAFDKEQDLLIQREVDPFGNILFESTPYFSIKKTYDHFDRPLYVKLPDNSQIQYEYDPLHLKTITRVRAKKLLYSHIFENYDLDGHLLSERLIGYLGRVEHQLDPKGRKISLLSPYFTQVNSFGSSNRLMSTKENKEFYEYVYDDLSQLTWEKSSMNHNFYNYNQNQNAFTPYGLQQTTPAEATECKYDVRGNLVWKKTATQTFQLSYNALNQLVEVVSEIQKVQFTYDPLGRRLSKTVTGEKEFSEQYLYDGEQEIGAFEECVCKNIKIIGHTPNSIACIEINNKPYACITDTRNNVRCLIDPISNALVANYSYNAFKLIGKEFDTPFNPWRYMGQRWDKELDLVYFNTRYYDPNLLKWLTPEFESQHAPYQFLHNNPLLSTQL